MRRNSRSHNNTCGIGGGSGGEADDSLPPLARATGGSCSLPKLGQGARHGGSRDGGATAVAASHAAVHPLAAQCSEGQLSVAHSPLSGSSKAAFPPDRVFTNDFQWTLYSRDLPLDVRPIIEDNKMMQEELRRYRMRVGEQEGLLASKDRQLVALRDELARERQRLKECGAVSPDQLLQDQQFRKELQDREACIFQLQQKANIMEKAKAAAERRLTNDLAAERKAQAELRRQIKQLQDEMTEKQKQSRFNQLHINQLYRRLEPLEAAVAAAALQPKQPPAPPPPEPEERVQLMFCMVYAQPAPTAAEIAEAAARLAAEEAAKAVAELRRRQEPAALRIQAAFRGFRARCQLATLHAAATKIQAAARGMLARRAVEKLRRQRLSEQERQADGQLSPSQRAALRKWRSKAGQQVRERQGTARAGSGRRSSLAPTRGANTAVEASSRHRSTTVGSGPGGGGSAGAGAGGSGGGSPAAGRRQSVSQPSLPMRSHPGRSGGFGSIISNSTGSDAGSASSSRRSSRAGIAAVPGLDLLQQTGQGRQQQRQGGGGPASNRSERGALGRQAAAGAAAQEGAQLYAPSKKPTVSLGFASSQPRRLPGM